MNAYERLEKAIRGKKDVTKLLKIKRTDKNGVSRYVYIKRSDIQSHDEKGRAEAGHANDEVHSTLVERLSKEKIRLKKLVEENPGVGFGKRHKDEIEMVKRRIKAFEEIINNEKKKSAPEEKRVEAAVVPEGYMKWFYESDSDAKIQFDNVDEFKAYVAEYLKNPGKYAGVKKEAGPKSTRTRGRDQGKRKERADKGKKRVFDPEKMAVVARMFSRETLDIISGIDKKARAMSAELGLSGDKAERLVAAFHAMPPRRGFDVGKFTANWAEFEKTPEYQAIMEGGGAGDSEQKQGRGWRGPDTGGEKITPVDMGTQKFTPGVAEEAPKGEKDAAPKFKKVKVDAEGIIDPTGHTVPLGVPVGKRMSDIVLKETSISGRVAGVVDDRFMIGDARAIFLPGIGVDAIREKTIDSLLSMTPKEKQRYIDQIGRDIEAGENVDSEEYKTAKKEFVEMSLAYSGAAFDAESNEDAAKNATDIAINRIAMKDLKDGKPVYSVGSYLYKKTPVIVLRDGDGETSTVVDAEQYMMMQTLFPGAVFGSPDSGAVGGSPLTVFLDGKPVAAIATMGPTVSKEMPDKFSTVKPDIKNQPSGNMPSIKKRDMKTELSKGTDKVINDLVEEAKSIFSGKEVQPTDENILKMTTIAKDPVSVATETIDWNTRRYLAYHNRAIEEGVWTDGRAMIVDKKFTDEFYPKMKKILEKRDGAEISGNDGTYPNWQQVIPGVVHKKTMTIDPSDLRGYKPVSPVGFLPNRGAKKSKGGNRVTFGDDFPDMDAQYFLMMRKQYPKASFYATGNMREPFLIVEGNTVRGIVMGMEKQ